MGSLLVSIIANIADTANVSTVVVVVIVSTVAKMYGCSSTMGYLVSVFYRGKHVNQIMQGGNNCFRPENKWERKLIKIWNA